VLDVVIAELIKGNYVIYQGDLSTEWIEKALDAAASLHSMPGVCSLVY